MRQDQFAEKEGNSNTGIIIGITVGCISLLLVTIMLIVVIFFMKQSGDSDIGNYIKTNEINAINQARDILLPEDHVKEKKINSLKEESGTTGERETVLDKDNVAEIAQDLEEKKKPRVFTAQMNFNAWHFATGDSESTDAYVANSMDNTNDIYFDMYLAGDEQNAIYESPILQRGSELRNIRLKTDLEAGTYDCIIVYHLIDEEQNTLGTSSFSISIIVEG